LKRASAPAALRTFLRHLANRHETLATMCGLVGYFGKALSKEWLRLLLQSMAHRGPDGEGVYHYRSLSIGMRRLSVIDIEGGGQPLFSRNGRVVAFQNGEIYNYKELRRELESRGYTFLTRSDTEVLAHGYDAWSIDGLLARVDGMYAIAIHDQDANELHLARDRFGEKPLFYSRTSDGFAFGSTLLAVGAMPWVTDGIDRLSLQRYLALHYVPGRRTILRDVERVLPGERLTIALDSLRVQHHGYYRACLKPARQVDDAELIEHVEHAVHSRLVADVPVGIFLSGGLDSSMIAAIATRANLDVATFSMGFDDPDFDESSAALRVARHIGSNHHDFKFDQSRFNELLPQVASTLDEPVGDQALLPLYWMCQEVKRHATVILSGEGADEIFAGYSYYRPFVDSGDWRARLRTLLDPAATPVSSLGGRRLLLDRPPCTPSGFPLLSDAHYRSSLLGARGEEVDAWEEDIAAWIASSFDPLQRATATDIATWLADDLLVKADRMTMAHSLEGRAPYLSPRLVEVALNLPQCERMTQTTSKVALRRIAKNYLPADIVDRPKQGFVLPMRAWLSAWFQFRGDPDTYFQARRFSGLDDARLASLVASDLAAGVQRERFLFAVIMLLEWWHAFRAKRESVVAMRSGSCEKASTRSIA
jgi:asparagine synthase (glutamine-hydrolysing)